MSTAIAQAVGDAMRRARALAAQREAVKTVLAKYSESPTVVDWGHAVLASDEPRGYRLLFRIAEREGGAPVASP